MTEKSLIDGKTIVGSIKFSRLPDGRHDIIVEYDPSVSSHSVLQLAVDAEVLNTEIKGEALRIELLGNGYTPISFFSPDNPVLKLNGNK
ncbi:MAG: hypothetical protein WCO98_14035 [bacterium]